MSDNPNQNNFIESAKKALAVGTVPFVATTPVAESAIPVQNTGHEINKDVPAMHTPLPEKNQKAAQAFRAMESMVEKGSKVDMQKVKDLLKSISDPATEAAKEHERRNAVKAMLKQHNDMTAPKQGEHRDPPPQNQGQSRGGKGR